MCRGGQESLGDEYVPARVSISSAEHEAINSGVWVHLRGGGSVKPIDKNSYRIEFHEFTNRGDQKTERSVLGMPLDTDWLLIGNAQESTAIRNYLCWEMWRAWNQDGDAPTLLESRLAELFVDNEYMGLYQILERIDIEEELVRMDGSLSSDSVARIIVGINIDEYPVLDLKKEANLWIEHRYEAKNDYERTFRRIEDYGKLMQTGENALTDEAFAQLAAQRIPVREMMSYYLFSQVCGLGSDNIFNNLYIWTVNREDGYVYYVSPWDMDLTFAVPSEGISVEKGESLEMSFSLPCRMLDLDVNGSRETMWEIWQEKRQNIISEDELHAWMTGIEEMINASGAYRRESEKWYGEAAELSSADILYYTLARVKNVENAMREVWPAPNMSEQ